MTIPETNFEVIVVGGGHAGTEAALAAARSGVRTLLLTQSIDTLGQMSCNPAIGGIGKSHLVREVDALGGVMARAADQAGIQFRVLNRRKGPAVRATRAQADRVLYRNAIRSALLYQPNLDVFQDSVEDLTLDGDRVSGAVTRSGLVFTAEAVVLTAGTFLNGQLHIGMTSQPGGRAGDAATLRLADRLRELCPRVGRLKTGTPPRLDRRTVHLGKLNEQWGDEPRPVMALYGDSADHPEQTCCWMTATNSETHDIIRGGLDRSPLFGGVIEGAGPRYCPSIEDKIHRFADKDSHQVFLEPEGLTTTELYPNGISTSLPYDIQLAVVRSMAGLAEAKITRPGYAIEYDYFDPRDLRHSLETRSIGGLFFAGQINGTTGYEEAAAQGLLAGLNAARQTRGETPWEPRRDEAYLGVLVDDLVTLGTAEPYRMFTSRAEHRLLLREDNADLRLTETARNMGLIGDAQWAIFSQRREEITAEVSRLETQFVQPGSAQAKQIEAKIPLPLSREYSLADLLRRPELRYSDVADLVSLRLVTTDHAGEQVETQIKYAGYIDRQAEEIARLQRQENTPIPTHLDYNEVRGLSNEIRQKLLEARPTTLARAARISGVTPAAISLLLVHLRRLESAPNVSHA